jgi:hypothetical protein
MRTLMPRVVFGMVAGCSIAVATAVVLPTKVRAQSLTPMEHAGTTPSDTKGFKLLVGNPYPTKMTFLVMPMDPGFAGEVGDAVVKPQKVTIGPGHARSVIVAFKIDPIQKERTIGLCVVPYKFDGPILPRVCGRYTGRMR